MYDETILNCITDKFKSVKEICDGTNIPYVRVSVRLRQLIKYDLVETLQRQSSSNNFKFLVYRKKKVLS